LSEASRNFAVLIKSVASHTLIKKKNEMSRAYDTYGRQENCIQSFAGKRERDYLEDLGVDGRIIL
jgi:hypothetical protein